MAVVNSESGTRIDEIAERIYRISTPVPPSAIPGGFTFNVFLIAAEESLLFHTGPRRIFPFVRDAIAKLTPLERLHHVAFSHFESDECGALNDLLELAPNAAPVCGKIGAMTSIGDFASRPPRVLGDGESLSLGDRSVRWLDMPHVPHGWDCGMLFDDKTRTFLCSDLFTQSGDKVAPQTESDILGPSEESRRHLEYYAHAPNTAAMLGKAAALKPATLACMHGSSWHGDGAALIGELAAILAK